MGKNKTGKRADIISDIKDNFLNDTNYNLDNVKKDLGLVKNFRFSIKTSELYDYVNWIIAIYFLIAVVALVPIVYKLLPIPNWIWTEWVQVCTQLKKYPDAVNNIRIVTDNERLKRSEWNHKKQLENEVTKRNR